MKKILSVVGARPNFMKIAPIHRTSGAFPNIRHSIVHTGQHYDAAMSDAFFRDLNMPEPAYFLGVGSGSHAEQTAKIMMAFEPICLEEKPDIILVAGDVNSTIACALVAVKIGIKVCHIESGLRSFDRTMPEEINRIATDSISDALFVTEQSGVDNLRREGISEEKIFFVGNTMIDSLRYALPFAERSEILQELGLYPKKFVLATLHRPSNVDSPEQLEEILRLLAELSRERDIIMPVHPRTRKNIERFGLQDLLSASPRLRLLEPQGYIHFLALMKNADFVLTDSGGIQEETTALGVPCLTMRTTTERPITCELGTNILVEPKPSAIQTEITELLRGNRKRGTIPPLWDGHAAQRILTIISEHLLG